MCSGSGGSVLVLSACLSAMDNYHSFLPPSLLSPGSPACRHCDGFPSGLPGPGWPGHESRVHTVHATTAAAHKEVLSLCTPSASDQHYVSRRHQVLQLSCFSCSLLPLRLRQPASCCLKGTKTKRLSAIASQPVCKWSRHEHRSVLISQLAEWTQSILSFSDDQTPYRYICARSAHPKKACIIRCFRTPCTGPESIIFWPCPNLCPTLNFAL